MIRISPSLAAAPMDNLREVVRRLESGGAGMVHFDIEDGSFVPVMTLGAKLVGDLRPLTDLPFDVHLMMVNPEWILPRLLKDGADRISVHYEACPYPRRTLRMIAEGGAAAGLAFNPGTPLPDLAYLQPYLDFVIILTSEPEVPDSPFLPQVLQKVRQGRSMPGMAEVEWVVDGGLNAGNLCTLRDVPVDTIVVGRAIFERGEVESNLQRLRSTLETGP